MHIHMLVHRVLAALETLLVRIECFQASKLKQSAKLVFGQLSTLGTKRDTIYVCVVQCESLVVAEVFLEHVVFLLAIGVRHVAIQ